MAGLPRIPLGRTAPRRGRREPSGTLARRDRCGPLAVYARTTLGWVSGRALKLENHRRKVNSWGPAELLRWLA